MNETQPIKDIKKINQIGAFLKEKGEKYYIMYSIGIQTGMQISSITNLTVNDMYSIVGKQRNRKYASVYINQSLLAIIEDYIERNDLLEDDYLIPSQRYGKDGRHTALGRTEAYRVIKKAGEVCGVENLGPMALRKTFGYHFYMQTGDLYMLMKVLGLKDSNSVLRYIGVDSDFNERRIEELEKFQLIG